VYVPENLDRRDRFLAGSDAHRAGLVDRMFADPEIKGIVCARGGYGSLRLLDLLSYESICSNPKVFVGFSDISALLVTLHERSGLAAFHGPVLTTLGKNEPQTKESFASALASRDRIEIQASKGVMVRPGSCTGIVTGGNLRTLCHLVGTAFEPVLKDRIVVLEDTGEAPYRIDRMLCHMRMAGCFKGVAGLALGTFTDCGGPEDVVTIVKDVFSDVDIPIMSGFDIGHGPVNLTIPIGIPAVLDTGNRTLSYKEAAVL
jgi:muramoyltetrapeptide carboxypeptidase